MLSNWVRTISVAMFVATFAAGMALVSWHELVVVRSDTHSTTLIAVIVKGEAVSVVSAAIAGAFEGGSYIVVIAYEMVKKGFSRGRADAFAEARKQNIAYYKRMREAHARGEEFSEPPPMFHDEESDEKED